MCNGVTIRASNHSLMSRAVRAFVGTAFLPSIGLGNSSSVGGQDGSIGPGGRGVGLGGIGLGGAAHAPGGGGGACTLAGCGLSNGGAAGLLRFDAVGGRGEEPAGGRGRGRAGDIPDQAEIPFIPTSGFIAAYCCASDSGGCIPCRTHRGLNLDSPGGHACPCENPLRAFIVGQVLAIGQSIEKGTILKFCGQQEIAPETGRAHWQFFVRFREPCRITGAKANLPFGIVVHLEIAYGTDQECFDYRSKEDTRAPGALQVRYGNPMGQGHRSDIESFWTAVRSGTSLMRLFDEHPGCMTRSYRAVEAYRALTSKPKEINPRCVIGLIGPPGVYKSSAVSWAFAGMGICRVPAQSSGTTYMGGYDGQRCVVWEDSYPTYGEFLSMCDINGYPFNVHAKGSERPFIPEFCCITNNFPPNRWWHALREKGLVDQGAVDRRFFALIVMDSTCTPQMIGNRIRLVIDDWKHYKATLSDRAPDFGPVPAFD